MQLKQCCKYQLNIAWRPGGEPLAVHRRAIGRSSVTWLRSDQRHSINIAKLCVRNQKSYLCCLLPLSRTADAPQAGGETL